MGREVTDIELLRRLKQDDPIAFKKIFEKYWETLLASALKRLASQEICEDIVQEVFADIWKRRAIIKITTNLKAYLHSAVKYQVFKAVEKGQQSQSIYDEEFAGMAVVQDHLDFDELYNILEIALHKLPQRQQLIFKMSRFEGLKSQEIAQKLNLSEQTIFNNLHKSLRTLRSELKEYAPIILGFVLLH